MVSRPFGKLWEARSQGRKRGNKKEKGEKRKNRATAPRPLKRNKKRGKKNEHSK